MACNLWIYDVYSHIFDKYIDNKGFIWVSQLRHIFSYFLCDFFVVKAHQKYILLRDTQYKLQNH